MTVAAYIAGILSVAVVILAAVLTGCGVRRWLLPDATGPIVAVAVAVGAVTYVVVLGEALGTIDGLRRWALVTVSAIVAVIGAARFYRAPAPRQQPGPTPSRWLSPVGAVAALCVALVLAESIAAIRYNAGTGILNIDALQYHLTTAAHFATSHRTTGFIHVSIGDPISYYPFNAELIHGIGMTLLGRDSLSLLLGTVDIGFVLLAAYAVGDTYAVGPAAVCAVSPLLALFGRVDASGLNDWASIWPMVAAVAIVLHGWRRDQRLDLRVVTLAGLALGLAAGTKADLLAPAVILGLVTICVTKRRVAGVGVLIGSALISGGYWYARDFIKVGSPLPSEHIPGLPRIPMSVIQSYGYDVMHYLTNGPVIHHYFIPGLHGFFGPGWIPLLILLAAGVVLGLARRGEGLIQLLGFAAVLCVGAYAVTPGTALGLPNQPTLFGVNLRYALPALILAGLLIAICLRSPLWSFLSSLAFLGVIIATLTDHLAWAAPNHRPRLEAIAVALIIVGTALQPRLRRHAVPTIAAVAVIGAIVGYPLQQRYLRHRYAPTTSPTQTLFHVLDNEHGLTIGVVGIPAQYPFLGPTWSNTVDYLGQPLAHHAFEDFVSCQPWRRAAAAYNLVVVETNPADRRAKKPPAYGWTASDSAAHIIFSNPAGTVFAITPGFAAQPCSAK